jgi:hypothetical protein
MKMFINSDTLYLPSFFRDLIYDKAKSVEWFIPGATCFFPDLVLFFIVHSFTFSFIKAMFFTGILMNILLILAYYLLVKESIKNISPLQISIGIYLLLLFHLAYLFNNDIVFSFYLTITNYHLGAYIASLFCLYFSVRYLRTNNYGNLISLLIIYILTLSSDFLTLVNLTIPLLSLTVLFFKKQYRRQSFYLLLTNILGLVFGFMFYRVLALSKALNILDISYTTFKFDRILESYSIMFKHHFLFIKTMDVRALIVLLCITSFIISLIILIKKLIKFFKSDKIENSELLELVYLLFIVIQIISVYNTPALNGAYMAYSLFRYNVYVFFLSMLNVGYLIHKLSLYKRFLLPVKIFSLLTIALFVLIGFRELNRINLREDSMRLFNYYPDYVKDIDELCVEYKLKNGLAGYWEARKITMLSRQDIRIYQTYENLRPFHHVVNQNWYYGTKDGKKAPTVFQFVLPDNLTDSIVFRKLEKHIIDTISKGDVTLIMTEPFTIERETKNLIFQ